MPIMKKLLTLMFLLFTSSIFCQQIIKSELLIDYKWANTKNEFALLFIDLNQNQLLYIYDAASYKWKSTFILPSDIYINSIEWDFNDESIFFCTYYNRESDCSMYQLKLESAELFPANVLDRYILSDMDQIDYSMKNNKTALLSSAEGDAKLIILDGKLDLILSLVPYPGFIEIIGWKENSLIVRTDVKLTEFKYKRNEFIISGTPSLFEDYKLFEINLDSMKIIASDIWPNDIRNISYNGEFYMKIQEDMEKKEITYTIY